MYATDKKVSHLSIENWASFLSLTHQTDPPCYNVSQLSVPTMLFTGSNDWLADPQDVQILLDKLTAAKASFTVHNLPDYEHLDFIWGINANREVYDVIIDDIINTEKN